MLAMPQVAPSDTQPQVAELVAAHVMPVGHGPPQKPEASGVLHPGDVVVVVVLVLVVLVVVLGTGQLGPPPDVEHASQQLVHVPMVPCFAVQCAASVLILHVVPLAVLRQHVTASRLPQVERDAHFLTNRVQLLLVRTVVACCAAQLTYAPCVVAEAQSQLAATAARAFAMSVLSGSVVGSHLARAGDVAARSANPASNAQA
jgi:hypothetical protein